MSKTPPTKVAGHDHHELHRVMGPGLLLLFILGDILGTGVYALTGKLAANVGGAAWAPILFAFAVATLSAYSYLELVTKYPGASGAALYAHKAFHKQFLTFMVTFAVLCSGLTSAATTSMTVANNINLGFGLNWSKTAVVALAIAFLISLAVVNFWGSSESVKLNMVLTLIGFLGLALVIGVGIWATINGNVDFSRTVIFEAPQDKSMFLVLSGVTALAFFSFVGFEDSVNMVEEVKDPRIFPKVMLSGMGICLAIYIAISLFTVAIVPIGVLANSDTPLFEVIARGAPGIPIHTLYPFITIFAVANTALLNMMMASRLVYGMAKQGVLPRPLGKIHRGRRTPYASIIFTTALGVGLLALVGLALGADTTSALGSTTALLLLAVFTVVNIACIVLRRDSAAEAHNHFRAPRWVPYLGAASTIFLIGPWAQKPVVYSIAAVLLLIGILLSVLNWLYQRNIKHTDAHLTMGDTQVIAQIVADIPPEDTRR
ncbi:APC family permease [Dermatophilus congolensis]|uniref:APC family permease n=1 Tax=Dermatophilus congolensis TaxID=1863 RepID=UPI001FB98E6E|nr:APC family permease [Dermatophilus congolensis]